MIHCKMATGNVCEKVASAKPVGLASAPSMPRLVTFGVIRRKDHPPTLASYWPREASTRCCASWISILRAVATRTTVGKSTARSRWSYIGAIRKRRLGEKPRLVAGATTDARAVGSARQRIRSPLGEGMAPAVCASRSIVSSLLPPCYALRLRGRLGGAEHQRHLRIHARQQLLVGIGHVDLDCA